MIHPLDAANLKVVWAQQRLNVLKQEISRYIHSDAYTITSEEHSKGRKYDVIIKDPPPNDISLIIGDSLCAMMASLDYLVWGLAGHYIGRPLVPPPLGKDKPSFPIYADSAKFPKSAGLSHYNVPATVITAIQNAQPYNAGYEPLAVLDALVNHDKHRLPLLTVGQTASVGIYEDSGDGHMFAGIAFGNRAVDTHVELPPGLQRPKPPAPVNVDREVVGYVAFDDPAMPREPVEMALQNIVDTIRDNVLPKFDRSWF